jgi:CelD/BcsL family acetyltransferase involved in cellulose biosynthesis
VTALDRLAQYATAWNELISLSTARLPMSSFAYIHPYFEHQLESGESWRCLFAFSGERMVGVLPLIMSAPRLLGISRKQFRAPSNTHVPSVTAYVAEGFESPTIGAFLKELLNSDPDYFSLSFTRVHESAAILHTAPETLRDVRMFTECVGNGSYVPITGDFPTYRASLSSNHRRNMRRWTNRLAKYPNVHYQFLCGDAATDEAAEQFFTIEASGWKGARHSAILSNQRRSEFYRSMVTKLREAGWLELHLLSADGRVIAGQMAMKIGGSLVIWKIAYDEAYAECGPGNLLFERGIERAFLQGDVAEVNCLTDMEWHKSWKMARRPYYDVFIYPRRAMTYVAGVVPRRTRSLVRQMPGVRPFVHLIRTVLSV